MTYISREEAVRLFAPDDPDVDVTHVFQGDVYDHLEVMIPRPGGKPDWPLMSAIVISHDCEWTKAKRRPEYPILIAPLRELGAFPPDQHALVREGKIRYLFALPQEEPLDDEFAADLRFMQPISAADLAEQEYVTSIIAELRLALRAKLVEYLTRELTLR